MCGPQELSRRYGQRIVGTKGADTGVQETSMFPSSWHDWGPRGPRPEETRRNRGEEMESTVGYTTSVIPTEP